MSGIALLVVSLASACVDSKSDPAAKLAAMIPAIMKADYEGDRASLDRLYAELDGFTRDRSTASRARYWKGYTKWRRAMNGANETPAPTDLAADAALCAEEMRLASTRDASFVDAKVGEMACLGPGLFFSQGGIGNDERIARLRTLMPDLKESAADNPRYWWAWGMAYFGAPPERGGGPDNVIRAYLKAMDAVKAGAAAPKTPLDPGWGEAELNVNLAYSYLNRPDPDLKLAKGYVDEAVRLAPNWHYAKDILRVQIEQAMAQSPP